MDADIRNEPGPGERVQPGGRRWTVLFIGDHGKVIAFKRIKTLMWLTIGVLVAALVAVGVLVAVNAGQHARARDLQQRLDSAQLEIQALREERDLLTAHVVLVETKMKETLAGVRRPAAWPRPDAAGVGKAIDRPGPPMPEPAAGQTAEPPESADDLRLPAGIGESVAVEDVHAGLNAARQTFDLRYSLAAARQDRKPLTGHVIAVFKGDHIEPERWLAMPRVDLPKGRPSGRQKGYSFSISHSKTFAHSMPAPASIPDFTRVVLYVFSHTGQLLTAREYGVDLKPAGG